jgi:hypothetical protein
MWLDAAMSMDGPTPEVADPAWVKASTIHVGSTIPHVGIVGLNPLAPIITTNRASFQAQSHH